MNTGGSYSSADADVETQTSFGLCSRECTHIVAPPSVNIQASTLAAISGHRRRDTMPEMAVSGAGPFRKRPDYGLDAKMRAKTDDASSNWCSQVGPQILSPSASLYRGPIVQLEADLGSMLIIWARAGALQTPLQPPKITLCTPRLAGVDDSILERGNRASKSYARDNCHYCDENKPLWFNAARLIGVEDGLHQKRRLLWCFGDDA